MINSTLCKYAMVGERPPTRISLLHNSGRAVNSGGKYFTAMLRLAKANWWISGVGNADIVLK